MPETYLTDRQIGERFGVHHLTPRRWVREDPTFPRPVKFSPGMHPVEVVRDRSLGSPQGAGQRKVTLIAYPPRLGRCKVG
jgi:hypothetical protein